MKKSLPIITSILLLLSGLARADLFLDVNTVSRHWSRSDVRQYDLSEVNPGLGISADNVPDDNGNLHDYMAGFYRNSVKRWSTYYTFGYHLADYHHGHFAIFAGGITGNAQGGLEPIAGLSANYQFDRLGLRLLLTPSMPAMQAYGFAGLQIRYRIP